MYINLSNEELKIMNIQFIHKLLSNDYISLDVYKKWYKIINNYQNYQKIIFNNFNTMKKNKNIPNYHLYDPNEPNFIIITSGQSNAGGWGTKYNSDIPIDQPDNRIQSYDIEQNYSADRRYLVMPSDTAYEFKYKNTDFEGTVR